MPGLRNKQQQEQEFVIGRARGGGRGRTQGGRGNRGRGRGATAPSAASPARSVAPPPAPARVAPAPASPRVEALAQELEEKARVPHDEPQLVQPLVRTHFPPRPGFGSLGKRVRLYANHFKVNFNLAGDVFHYDVMMAEGGRSFGNDGPPKALANKIMAALMAELRRLFPSFQLVSDARKNVYAPKRLPFQLQEFAGLQLPEDGGRAREFSAVVKEADPVAIRMQQLEAKYQHSAFSKAIRGVKVNITHRPGVKRSYRVNGLSRDSADNTFFENDEGQRMSIAQYFQQTYNIRLRYPMLPCLHVGAPQKKNYLPMEVCHIMACQKCPRKVTDKQVANMIRFTCTRPDDRKRSIEQKFREAGFNTDPTLKAFGLDVEPRMVETTGRQLPPPTIEYSGGARESPRGGAWNMRNKRFNTPAQFKSWAVISMCDPNRCGLGDIQKFFKAQMGQLGMGCPRTPPPILLKQNRQDSVRYLFGKAVKAATNTFKSPPQIVWMINPIADAASQVDATVPL